MPFNLFDTDKAGHYIAGSVAAALAALLIVGPLHEPEWASAIAVLAAFAVGGLKEAADWRSNRRRIAAGQTPRHGVEWGDWAATTLGGVPVAAPLLMHTLIARGVFT